MARRSDGPAMVSPMARAVAGLSARRDAIEDSSVNSLPSFGRGRVRLGERREEKSREDSGIMSLPASKDRLLLEVNFAKEGGACPGRGGASESARLGNGDFPETFLIGLSWPTFADYHNNNSRFARGRDSDEMCTRPSVGLLGD